CSRLMLPSPPASTRFPYTTLFRSRAKAGEGPVTLAVVTVSDTRTPENDANRQYIEQRMTELGHRVAAYRLIKDEPAQVAAALDEDRKSTRLNSSHVKISYAVFCLK